MMDNFDAEALEALEFGRATTVEIRTARAIRYVAFGRPFNHYLAAARTLIELGYDSFDIHQYYHAVGLTYERVRAALDETLED